MSIAILLNKKESTGTSFWIAPEVPILIKLRDFFELKTSPVSKLRLTKASSSFKTISIFDEPIPVEITVILFDL